MNWSDVAPKVAAAAPILGTLLGGPAGAAVGGLIASALGTAADPEDVSKVLTTNPDAAVKLRQIEAERSVKLQELLVAAEQNRLTAETSQIQAVNATMQAESKADHWPTYTWRPFVGFVFGVTFFGTYFMLPLLKLPVPVVPFEAWACIGAVLGVASWYRGKMQADPRIATDNRG